MTSQDPYLRQHEARYTQDDRIDQRLATRRRLPLGFVVVLMIVLAIVAVIALGPAVTTDPVESPAATEPVGAPVPQTDAPEAPLAPAQDAAPDGSVAPAAPDGSPIE